MALARRVFLLLLLATPRLEAQLQDSVVGGRVFAPDGTPFRGARVVLRDALGRLIIRVTSDGEGRFRMRAVAPGLYQLGAEAASLRSPWQPLSVGGGRAVALDLWLTPQLRESVAVSSDGTGAGGSSGTTIAGEAVRRKATPLRGGSLRSAVAETPGWTSEDNGLMHYRGADDGLLFVLDGIPVYERLDPQFGVGFDPLALRSVRVLSGYVPPEFGLRSGGVVEVRSQPGSTDSWSGVVETGIGRHHGQALSSLAQGPIAGNAGLMVSLGGERSRRFLDPVSLHNLHNQGSTSGGEAELAWAPGTNAVTLRAGHARSSFDVPNDEEQAASGQDQRQKLRQAFATVNWQRSWSNTTVSQLGFFGRFTNARLLGSPSDTPLFTEAHREQDRLGILAAVEQARGRHRLKAGVETSWMRLDERLQFFVTDRQRGEEADLSEKALEHDADNRFDFGGHVRRPIYSLYVQDSWRPVDRLVVDLGVRYDRTRLLLTEEQWSPRIGVSYRVGRATLRASLNRFFQPPQSEYLLLSSSPAARELSPFAVEPGAGGADIPAERQFAVEAGGELWLGGALRADIAVWRRWIRNQADPNVFFGTTIAFPNSVDRGRAQGLDVRLEVPRRSGISGFVTYTLAKVEQFGPINGGLFLEDDLIDIGPGTKFTPDHDQRHALSAEISYDGDDDGLWVAVGGRYRSGTPLEVPDEELAELAQRPGADLVDFEQKRVKPHFVLDAQAGRRLIRRARFELSARASVLNLIGARYAFNFGNPFSGTHFGAPRSVKLDLRLALR